MSVTIRVPGYATPESKQVRLSEQTAGTVVLPWWPDEIATSNIASVYEEQARPGREPLLLRSGDSLPELRIGCIVSTSDLSQEGSVADVLTALRQLARARKPVKVKIASRSGQYRVTDLGITEMEWDAGSGDPSSAEVSLTLVTSSDAVVPVGPIKKKPRR